MTKRIISMVLVVVLVVILAPANALAASVQENKSVVGVEEGAFIYSIKDDEVTITGVTDSEIEDLVFPDSIEGLPVTQINGNFSNCEKVKSITVPDSVKNIANESFKGLNPTKITIPFVGYRRDQSEGVFVTFGAMFSHNQRLGNNYVPAELTKQISCRGSNGYYYGYYYEIPKSIKEVVITDATLIPDNAFYNCSWIEKITINDIAEESAIGKEAFYNCKAKLYVNRGTALHSYCEKTKHSHCSTKEVYFDKQSITLYKDESKITKANVILLNGSLDTQPETVYTSSNNNVAKVDEKTGEITSVAPGTTTVIADSEGVTASIEVTVLYKLENISLDKTKIQIDIGKSELLSVSYYPENTTDSRDIIWSSSDDTVASVDDSGNVTAHKKGRATISAKTYNSITATCIVDVLSPITNIEIQEREITIARSKKQKLNIFVTPNDNTDTYSWVSSDTSVATVDNYGTVTARKVGTAIITVTTNRGLSADCKVTVNSPATFIQISEKEANLFAGQEIQLTASLAPYDVTDKKTWTSSDSSIAEVDDNGLVTAKNKGVVSITVSADSGISDTCIVNVENDINATVINLEYEQTEFDMQPKEPTVSVTYNNTELVQDKHYRIEYDNNTEAGEAIVTVYSMFGDSNHICYFTINPVDIKTCEILYDSKVPFVRGTSHKAITNITFNSIPLIENYDYEVNYSDNKDLGIASVEIRGKGNYSSTLTLQYEIKGLLGDLNSDGIITITDVTIMQRFIAEISVDYINDTVADINHDGIVSITDATLLQKYLADYDVPESSQIGKVE